MRIIWQPTAIRDLRNQREYLAEQQSPGADAIIQRILDAAEHLAEYPLRGRRGRRPRTRESVVARTPNIVVYRVLPDTDVIQILRVLHGAQEWPPR